MRRTLAAAVLLAALATPSAHAGGIKLPPEPTREEFVTAAEPICKVNVRANRTIFRGAKRKVKEGDLTQASRHFFRAATAFSETIRELSSLPRPPTDVVKLRRWLKLLRTERDLVREIGRALAAGTKGRAEALSVRLNRNSNRANNMVLAFGFDYCRIEPSRFG